MSNGLALPRVLLAGPQFYAVLPGLILGAFWLGGEPLLILTAVLLPLALLGLGIFASTRQVKLAGTSDSRTQVGAHLLIEEMDSQLQEARTAMLKCACFMIQIDDYDELTSRFGHSAAQHVIDTTLDRLRAAVRIRDKVFLVADGRAAITIAPVLQFDFDIGLQLATRLQSAVEEPVTLDGTTIYMSVSIGFCLGTQLKPLSGTTLAKAADLALTEACQHAPSAIRSYSTDMRAMKSAPQIVSDEVIHALEEGHILPWFQPQISTDTGQITGFEALARWIHPDRGIIPPSDFLPLLERGSRLERLSEVMLYHSLKALVTWDTQGITIPHVGVNFASEELRNPRLLDKIKWELDRFSLTPDRLVVEILETVVATSPDDVVTRNINGLSTLGCKIDLDDFGTGHASISSVRRFAIERLKIDRSFVMKVDKDADQQRMVSAILLMADRLGLDTLAEGVETAGEHNMLAQLGCGHVQGFGLARPMPFEKTGGWIADHNAKLDATPMIDRKFG